MSTTRPQSHNQGVSRDALIYGGSGNDSASKIIHDVGRIQLHAAVGLMSLFPCCSMREEGLFQPLETFRIPWFFTLICHLQRSRLSPHTSNIWVSASPPCYFPFYHISLTLLLSFFLCFFFLFYWHTERYITIQFYECGDQCTPVKPSQQSMS